MARSPFSDPGIHVIRFSGCFEKKAAGFLGKPAAGLRLINIVTAARTSPSGGYATTNGG